jgi:hypothetical protein
MAARGRTYACEHSESEEVDDHEEGGDRDDAE